MKISAKILSHVAAGAVGILLALAASKGRPSAGKLVISDQAIDHRNGTVSNRQTDSQTRVGRAASVSRAAVYRQAWMDLGKESLNKRDRLAIQAKLLQEWAKIDLHGALEAYLGETWDERRFAIDGGDPLSNAFAAAFAADPMNSWNVLSGREMAMAKQLLAGMWGQVVGEKDPGMVISVIAEMTPTVGITRLRHIFSNERDLSLEEREDLFAKLGEAGDAKQFENWIKAIGGDPPVDPAQAIGKWSAMASGPGRTREMSAWAASLNRLDPEGFSTEWGKVPEEDRGQAARLLLARMDNRSPALLQVIDNAVAAGQWDALKENVADKLRGHPGSGTPELREWALTLPEREETRAIYNLAISESLLRDPAGGRQWLESLPAGSWHREAGFVEMVLGSIWARGDLNAARRAAGDIADPRMAQEASKVMYDWQLLMRKTEIVR